MSDETRDNEPKDEIIDNEANNSEYGIADDSNITETHSDYVPGRFDASAVHHLSGMYQNWFLDYASYVILERAVPNIESL